MNAMKELIFYYDVICPYAFLASRLVERVAETAGAKIKWRPVLLGGIYKATKPAEETATKAFQKINPTKQQILGKDLLRLYHRYGIAALPINKIPELSTLGPMRLLAACSNETSDLRRNLTHELYKMLWAENKDVSDVSVLEMAVKKLKWDVDVESIVSGKDSLGKTVLFDNTKEAIDRGAFGVPSFWVNDRLYFGADRLDFVERALGNSMAAPLRLCAPASGPSTKRKLRIFHDFASPWCYVAFHRMNSFIQSLNPEEVEVEWVPILLGAIFQQIGSPMLPLFTQGESKRKYAMQDFHDWLDYLNATDFQFPRDFPHKSITALRVTIANDSDNLRAAIYNAAWTKDADIGDAEILSDVITKAGYDASQLFEAAKSQQIKDQLRDNTQMAASLGICGVPSFQVDDQPVIWGQDRLHIVADELCGWQDNVEETVQSIMNSKL